jgi:hypothetical protein
MVYVWQTPYKGAQKLMLMAIADRCDDEGVCYPGVPSLAKKCSVKQRAAQALIAQLEGKGEIVVVLGQGIETGHGKTSRYYMKKYRDEIGLSTPAAATRIAQITPVEGMQDSTSRSDGMQNFTSQGMQDSTSQGMQNSASNTSVDSSVDTKESVASDEARARTAHSSEKTASVKDTAQPTPEQPAKEARARTPRQIEAVAAAEGLAAAMGVTLASSDYGLYKKHAALLVSAGVTLAEFDLYVKRVRRAADGKWTVTVTSLTANGRISEYITARDAHRARQQAGEAQGQWTGETASAQYHQPAVIVPESTTVNADVLTMFEEATHE